MQMKSLKLFTLVLCSMAWMMTGCTGTQSISNYARSGDTVILALGGTHATAQVPILTMANTSVDITDAGGNIYPVKLRHLFRLYADPTSRYSFRSVASIFTWDTYVAPHQGMWVAVIDLADPATGDPLPLQVGNASLSVSSPGELIPTLLNSVTFFNDGDLRNVGIEILPGTGAPHMMNTAWTGSPQPLQSLQPSPQIAVTASGTPTTRVGGGSFTFSYVNAVFPPQVRPLVVTTAADPNVQLASHYLDQGDGTTQLNVIIRNPHGFNTSNSKSGLATGNSMLRSLRFNIIWFDRNTSMKEDNWQDYLQLVSAEYIDTEANPMPELVAEVTRLKK